MKKGDIKLIVCILLAAVLIFAVILLVKQDGKTVIVKKDDAVVFEGSLFEDKVIGLDGNTVVIEGGFAYMREADCKNQICVRTRKISSKGESVICLPNRVIIEIN